MLRFFSASTSIVNSRRAIAECLENALMGENSLDCDLLVIFSAIGHNFSELLAEAHHLAPSARIVGCTAAGVIGIEGADESMKGLAIMAVKGDKSRFAVAACSKPEVPGKKASFEIGEKLAKDLIKQCPDINMIFLYPDCLYNYALNIIIEGVESVFGKDIPVCGGASIDNMKLVNSFQFLDDQIFESGAIMFGLGDPDLEVITCANHGFEPIGDPFTITGSDGSFLYQLDGIPAWKRLTERLGLPENTEHKDTLIFGPLGAKIDPLSSKEYESNFKIYGYLPAANQSIRFAMEIPVDGELWLMRRNEELIYDGVERLMVKMLDKCNGREPKAIFHADCLVRGKLLFNRIIKDEIISHIQYPLCKGKPIPWIGMYAGGEFAPLAGKNIMHAYTTSLFAIAEKDKKPSVKQIRPEIRENKSVMFESSRINNILLKNRFIHSGTWMGEANINGSPSPDLIYSMIKVARQEIGLFITEMAYVSREGLCVPSHLAASDRSYRLGLKRMSDFVHRAGSPVVLQIAHGGLYASPAFSGSIPMGPSPLELPGGSMGISMSKVNIEESVKAFANAALLAKDSGFDGVQINAAHGWLIGQFLSPFFNKRKDEYGGNLENRSRLLLEIVQAIRQTVGSGFALLVKIDSDDFLPGGFNLEEMLSCCSMLEQAGIDAVETSGGTIGALLAGNIENSFAPVLKPGAYYQQASKKLKKQIKIPVILVGGIRSFEMSEQLVNEGITDYVSLCRPLIREPNLVRRWKEGDLRKAACLSDNACLYNGLSGKTVHCMKLSPVQ